MILEENSEKKLVPLSSLVRQLTDGTPDRREYAKIRDRMKQGTMVRYIIDEQLYFDLDEYNNFKPRRAGRRIKV